MRCLIIIWLHMVESGLGWDSDGHKIVAKLAGSLISKKAAKFVTHHVQGVDIGSKRMKRIEHTLASIASWADAVSDEIPWSKDLHFSHTPYRGCRPFDFDRDCGAKNNRGRCVVSAIANYTARATDVALSQDDRAEAIKFLVHFVADIHSPMHVGFAKDGGGNGILVYLTAGGMETTLHEVWDRHIIDSMKGDIGGENVDWKQLLQSTFDPRFIDSNAVATPTEDALEFASLIATETATEVTCKSGYTLDGIHYIEPETDLSIFRYIESRKDVVRSQLLKAAVRLASLLESIASKFNQQRAKARFEALVQQEARGLMMHENRYALLEDIAYDPDDPDEVIDDTLPEPPNVPSVVEVTEEPFDVANLVLIVRQAMTYIVPRRKVRSRNWIPTDAFPVQVRVGEHDIIEVFLDSSIPLEMRQGEAAGRLWREVLERISPWWIMGDVGLLYQSHVPEIKFSSVSIDSSKVGPSLADFRESLLDISFQIRIFEPS